MRVTGSPCRFGPATLNFEPFNLARRHQVVLAIQCHNSFREFFGCLAPSLSTGNELPISEGRPQKGTRHSSFRSRRLLLSVSIDGSKPNAFQTVSFEQVSPLFSDVPCTRGVRSQRAASRLSRRFLLLGHFCCRVRAPLSSGDFQSQPDSTDFQPVVVE
jgi:hypothetical protein